MIDRKTIETRTEMNFKTEISLVLSYVNFLESALSFVSLPTTYVSSPCVCPVYGISLGIPAVFITVKFWTGCHPRPAI